MPVTKTIKILLLVGNSKTPMKEGVDIQL